MSYWLKVAVCWLLFAAFVAVACLQQFTVVPHSAP